MYGPAPPVTGLGPVPAPPVLMPPLPIGSKIIPPAVPGEAPVELPAPLTFESGSLPQPGRTNNTGSARQLTSKVEHTVRAERLDCFEGIDSGIDLGSPTNSGLTRKCRVARKPIANIPRVLSRTPQS